MARNVSKQDESFREYALNAAPVRVLMSVCAPLALYQALQQVFKVLDALLAGCFSIQSAAGGLLVAVGLGLNTWLDSRRK